MAYFPIINLASQRLRMTPKDITLDAPGISLGLRLACTVFLRDFDVNYLVR